VHLARGVAVALRMRVMERPPPLPEKTNASHIRGVYHSHVESQLSGATENAGLENSGPSKMQGWKTQDWKTRDHHSGGGKRDQ